VAHRISHTFLYCLLESAYAFSVTENASPEKGWRTLNARLYSILGHALGMPLFLLLDFLDKDDLDRPADNRPSSKKTADRFHSYLKEVFSEGYDLSYLGFDTNDLVQYVHSAVDGRDELSAELAKTICTWYESDEGETALTARMAEPLGASPVMQGTAGLLGSDQDPTKGLQLLTTDEVKIEDLESGGRYDILLTAPTTNAPVALLKLDWKIHYGGGNSIRLSPMWTYFRIWDIRPRNLARSLPPGLATNQ
jgi:hypothetical protein